MAINWNKALGTYADGLITLTGVGALGQLASYGLTGQSIGEHLTGDSLAPEIGRHPDQKKKRSGSTMSEFQNVLAQAQAQKAEDIYAELEAQGRPVMDAQVQRQQEISNLAEMMSREGMPEEQYQNAVQQIERGTQSGLAAASSRGAGMQSLAGLYGNQNQAMSNLAAQDAGMAQQNQQNYLRSLAALGAAEGQAEGYNELMPYEQQLAYAQALEGSGIQNNMGMLNFNYMQQVQNQQQLMDIAGMGLQTAGMVAPMVASDIRLKDQITHTGYSPSGIPIYTWVYKDDLTRQRYSGTMAQDLIKMGREDAVVTANNGFFAVDYSVIDVPFKQI